MGTWHFPTSKTKEALVLYYTSYTIHYIFINRIIILTRGISHISKFFFSSDNELTKYKDLPISKRKCVEHQLVSRRGNPSDWRALAQQLGIKPRALFFVLLIFFFQCTWNKR